MSNAQVDSGRIEFVKDYEQLLRAWPSDTKWPLTTIAGEMHRPVPFVVGLLSELTDRELDIHDPLTYREADRILTIIKQRLRPEIEMYELARQRLREKIRVDYTAIAEKILVLQKEKNWHSAYRTLSYFAGRHQNHVDAAMFVSLCDECLRLGQKAQINHQELGLWLQRAIRSCFQTVTPESFEDALDLIEAYSEYFLADPSGKGELVVTGVLETLARPAVELALIDRLREFCHGLGVEIELFGAWAPTV